MVCFAKELERFVHDTHDKREISLKALLCTRIAFPYTMREPEIN